MTLNGNYVSRKGLRVVSFLLEHQNKIKQTSAFKAGNGKFIINNMNIGMNIF